MPRFAPLTGLLLSIAACACADARAENSFGIVSDYRYRGLSLSDGEPGLQAGLVWDRDDGWYAGVFAATTRIGGRDGVQAISYLGRAWRLRSGRRDHTPQTIGTLAASEASIICSIGHMRWRKPGSSPGRPAPSSPSRSPESSSVTGHASATAAPAVTESAE